MVIAEKHECCFRILLFPCFFYKELRNEKPTAIVFLKPFFCLLSGNAYLKGQAVLMRMLVAVSSLYILCTAPNILLAMARFTVKEFRADGLYGNLFFATHMIGVVIVMLNSSINFFVYLIMSSRFRQELNTCFLCTRSSASIQNELLASKSEQSKTLSKAH